MEVWKESTLFILNYSFLINSMKYKIIEYMTHMLWDHWSSHDIDHTLRVRNLCMKIWEAEWADLEILEIAALLHDIWRPKEFETKWEICHAEYWAQLAKDFLEHLWLPQDKIDSIVYCISTHRFRKWKTPETLEAKILFDADKLDCIWAVGIGRAFMCAWEIGAKLHNEKWVDSNKNELDSLRWHKSLSKLFCKNPFFSGVARGKY